MSAIRLKYNVLFIILVLLIQETICKRGGSNGRPRTTPRTTHRQTTHTTHQENNYQLSNAPPPSAPVQHQQNNNPIGFDNVNRQSSSHPIGFEAQNRPPLGNQPPPNVGFNNNGYTQQQFSGNNPQVPLQQSNYNGYNQAPPQSHYNGYNPQVSPQSGTWHPQNGYNSHVGSYNPNSGAYYNNFATPGIQPQFYQPTQQSNSFGAGSLLGIAGSFGGGYLLGRLTSGGHDNKESKDSSNTNGQQFVVHHYYHNSEVIPKQITVSNNSSVTCMQNMTKLCVPNTFPMCFSNGTIMCVTHTRFTVPCSTNTTMSCIITALPCTNKDKTCNPVSNLSGTVVYVPCISNLTITGQNDTTGLGNNELCITAIAEPAKKLDSPVPSLINLMSIISTLPLELQAMNISGTMNVTTMPTEVKTEMPTKIRDT